MSNRLFRTLVFCILVVGLVFVHSTKTFASTGFLDGPMWINPETPQDGELVNLSALFHNAEPNQLSGDVVFYDGSVLLGRKTITIDSGGVSTATVSFRIGAGSHSFSATIGNLSESLGNGTTEPFVLSPQTVQLPQISVSSKAGDALTASIISGVSNFPQAQISATSPLAPVVNGVNQLESNVLSSIPNSVKNPVSDTVVGIDSWREKNADVFGQVAKSSALSAQKASLLVTDAQKRFGKAPFSSSFVDRPFAYVKLFFFTLMSFLYSHAIVFYGSFILLLYIIGRFVFGKISGAQKKGSKSRPAHKTYSRATKFQE